MAITEGPASTEIKGVIFDLGNTLLFFNGEWDEVAKELYAELSRSLISLGFDLEKAEFIHLFHSQIQAYFEDRDRRHIELTTAFVLQNTLADLGFSQITEEELKRPLAEMYAVSQQRWLVENDAITTLNFLLETGYRVGMISNAGNDDDVQTLIDNAGFRPYFDFILTSAAEGYRKPNQKIFQKVFDYWHFLPGEIAMVGDTLEADILGAIDMEMVSIWITRRVQIPNDADILLSIQPDYKIDSLSELPALLSQIK